MQRKYNMALQHFYQAATHSNEDRELKSRLANLSGSEEDLFTKENGKTESYEMHEKNSDFNENTYFTFKKEMSVKQVRPNGICSWRNCMLLCVWLLLFIIGVLSITYFLQIAVGKIKPKEYGEQPKLPVNYERFKEKTAGKNTLETCSDFHVEKIWHKTHDKFQTESAIRLVDINEDGHDDIIMGFVTSLDGYGKIGTRRNLCTKYYNDTYPCFGGVLAADGVTGASLWIHYSFHDIYAVNCNGDINNDGIADCLIAGRGGVFEAISGKDGSLIWMFLDSRYRDEMMNLYTPQFINDVDNDGVLDVLQIHGGDPMAEAGSDKRLTGRILFLSGKTGVVLTALDMPDDTESYSSPVIYNLKNGSEVVIFGNGGETHKGSLFAIMLKDLYDGKIDKAVRILTDSDKGFMNPPILVDINKDGVVDIINPGYTDSITAIDGETFKILWSYTKPGTETYSIPGVGYYNDDDVVDFFVKLNTGPGFPVYYDSKMLILDGKTGLPITEPYKTSAPAHSSPLSVSMEGAGNDLFVYWVVDCEGHEHEGGAFRYVPGTNVHESSRADSCQARFDTKSFSKLYVMNKKVGFPGKEIYYSHDYAKLEHGLSELSDIRKRHIGIPDHGGVQRLIQTGTIVPSLSIKNRHELSTSFDVVFAMYYIQSPNVRAIRPSDTKCIKDYRKKAKEGKAVNKVDLDINQNLGIFDDGDTATNYCLGQRLNDTKFDNQETANKKNFNRGKLTLYRFKVTCKCDQGKKCAKVLPQNEQGWTGYMGSLNNGYFKERLLGRFHPKRAL